LLFSDLGGMSDLQHYPLCDPEEEVLPFEFVPARGNTDESNRKVSDKSKALPTFSRPSGIAVARSGIHLMLMFSSFLNASFQLLSVAELISKINLIILCDY
jgi:hypothetical protein